MPIDVPDILLITVNDSGWFTVGGQPKVNPQVGVAAQRHGH